MNWLDEIEVEELEPVFHAEESEEQLKERFKITDLASLNWALRKLSALSKSHTEELELVNAEIQRIQEWFAKQDETYQYSKQFLEGLIGEYAAEQRKADPKWRQRSPYGYVSFRKQQPKWNYNDEVLEEYLVGSEWEKDYTRTKIEPDKTKIKESQIFKVQGEKIINTVTGEVVPGVTVIEREPTVTIKLEG